MVLTSIAFSAFVSCITPTVALATRISRITKGSTKAPPNVESSELSNRASTKDIMADASRMSTS